jgi:hypothetical protein
MLDREAKREKTLEAAVRERRIKAGQKRPNSAITPEGAALKDFLKSADEEFFASLGSDDGGSRSAAIARAAEFDRGI